MSDQYRLVYSGEVLQGQHPAVVKKRLAAVLKLSDERADVLFCGKPVVVKKTIDKENAARYQAVFEKAGAQLRVLPLDEGNAALPAETPPESNAPAQAGQAAPGGDSAAADDLQVLPVGADMLTSDERAQVPDVDIDTSHLSVQGAVFNVDEPVEELPGPNVDHITLAELGAQIGNSNPGDIVVAEVDVDFSLAEAGAIIGEVDAAPPAAAVDMNAVNFEVAEPGADMDTSEKAPPPPPPDTSHLQIDEQDDQDKQ